VWKTAVMRGRAENGGDEPLDVDIDDEDDDDD
jgi:hypothetical protein